jgi:hypothetical protein
MSNHSIGVEVAVEVITAAFAVPVEQTNDEGDNESTNSASDAAYNCTSTAAVTTSR